jgi:class 3 adenylate cyclase
MQIQSFAALLKDFRLASGLTQEALAERAGVSTRTVSDLERGLYQAPHRDTVERLVEALRLRSDDRAALEAAISRSRGPASGAPSVSSTNGGYQSSLPTGVLTLLMTEIDGSSHYWEHHADGMRAALSRYDEILMEGVVGRGGALITQVGPGDGRLGVFRLASDAVAAAVEVQRRLTAEQWPVDVPLRARLALYAGEADLRDGTYYGNAISRCTRLRALAAAGQSLMSESVWSLVRATLPAGTTVRDLAEHQLSDHGRPERLIELVPPGVPAEFPPLRSSSLLGHYETVVRALLDGRVVLFVGDGINLTGRPTGKAWRRGQSNDLPAANELAAALAEGFGYSTPAPAELPRVAQYVSTLVGSGPLYEALHTLLDADYRPTPAHRFLAGLPAALTRRGAVARAPLIVTTSLDQGIERAFAEAGEVLDVVAYVADGEQRGRFVHRSPDGRSRTIDKPNKYLGLSDSRAILLKVHGAVDRGNPDQDSFVVTEDHFLDYMTGGEISGLVPVTIAARFRRSHFLFLGYGLRDWNLRVILRRLWGEQRLTYKSWSVHSTSPEPIELGLWRERGVDVLDVDLPHYLAGLEERLHALPLAEDVV